MAHEIEQERRDRDRDGIEQAMADRVALEHLEGLFDLLRKVRVERSVAEHRQRARDVRARARRAIRRAEGASQHAPRQLDHAVLEKVLDDLSGRPDLPIARDHSPVDRPMPRESCGRLSAMRSIATLVMFAACASTPKSPHVPVDPPKPLDTVAPAAISAAPELDEASLKAKSRAFLDAVDDFDKASVVETLSPAFVRFAGQRFADTDLFVKALENSLATHTPVRSRTYAEESLRRSQRGALHHPRHAPHPERRRAPGRRRRGLGHARVGPRGRSLAGRPLAVAVRGSRGRARGVGRQVQALERLQPQAEPAAGRHREGQEGGDRARSRDGAGPERGVPRPPAGRSRASTSPTRACGSRGNAAAKKVKLETVNAEMEKYDLGKDKWDLVTLIYAGDNHDVIERGSSASRRAGCSSWSSSRRMR